MPELDIVTLAVNGKVYSGWKQITVTDSIQSAAASFELSVSERWQIGEGHDRQLKNWKLKAGDSCVASVAGSPVVTGYIDVHRPTLTATSHDVSVSGRSKTGDLIDCSAIHSPGNFVNMPISAIANALTGPFGIATIMSGPDSVVPKFELDNSETVFEAIERLIRKYQLLITSTSSGMLELGVSPKGAYGFVLDNTVFESITPTTDYSRIYSEYRGKAQRHGPDDDDPLKAARVYEKIDISGVKRFRPIIIRPEGTTTKVDTKKRISWQASRDLADALKAEVKVKGLTTPGGAVWKKNMTIPVYEPEVAINNTLLIESVRFEKSNQGTYTTLGLVHPDAYTPEPPTGSPDAGGAGQYFDL